MAKTKGQILDLFAKDKMVEWDLTGFKNSFPSLFAVIGSAMEEYAKQEAIAFDEWKREAGYKRTWLLSDTTRWWLAEGLGSYSSEELYLLYQKTK